MAIVSCPECSKKLKVADTSVGKKVKCSCGNVFVASADESGATPAPMASDKVVAACTECGAKLKVGTASLGKKMKCPKCAAVFVAAAEEAPKKAVPTPPPESEPEDDFEEPAPKKKAKAVSDEDMDDLLNFAEDDAKADDSPFQDEEDEPKSKAKPKKPADDDDDIPSVKPVKAVDDDDDEPKPKSKAAQRGAPPPRFNDEEQKPVYPRRTLLNLFVFFLLFLFVGAFAVVFLGVYTPKLGELKDDTKRITPKQTTDEIDGDWIVQSAEKDGRPDPAYKSTKWQFSRNKVTAPHLKDADFTNNSFMEPNTLDIIGEKGQLIGIYKIDGDTMQICFAESKLSKDDAGKEIITPGERPTKFESKKALLLTLKRDKKADEAKDGDADKEKGKEKKKDKEGDANKEISRADSGLRSNVSRALDRMVSRARTETIARLKKTPLAVSFPYA